MDEMTDHDAIEDMRRGGHEGVEVLRQRYEDRLRQHLMSPPYQLDDSLAREICEDVFFQKIKLPKKEDDAFNQLLSLAERRYQIENAIKDIRQKGRKGIEFFFHNFEWSLRAFLMSPHPHGYALTQSDAEEICNDAFRQFYMKIDQLRRNGHAVAWLYTIAGNQAKKRIPKIIKLRETEKPLPSENYLSSETMDKKPLDGHPGLEPIDKPLNDDDPEYSPYYFQDVIEEPCYERCVREALARLQHNRNTKNRLTALILSAEEVSIEEITAKIGKKSDNATRVFLHDCRKKLKTDSELKRCLKDCQREQTEEFHHVK